MLRKRARESEVQKVSEKGRAKSESLKKVAWLPGHSTERL